MSPSVITQPLVTLCLPLSRPGTGRLMGDMRKVCLNTEITSACGKLLVAALASRCATLTRIPLRLIPQLPQGTRLAHGMGAWHAAGDPCDTAFLSC